MAQEDWVIHDVPLKDIKDVPRSGLNVRLTDRNVAIQDLAASIKKHSSPFWFGASLGGLRMS